MIFEVLWHDVTDAVKKQKQPTIMLERPMPGNRTTNHGSVFTAGAVGRVGEFWVPQGPSNQDEIEWCLTTAGDFVRVPIHSYTVPQASKSLILAVGMELGFRTAIAFVKKSTRSIEQVTLVLGTKVDSVDNGYRCYAGIAIKAA